MWPFRCLGQEGMGLPRDSQRDIVDGRGRGTNMFWAERFGRETAPDTVGQAVRQFAHGSFKDLGMMVLVSVVKQMVANGAGVGGVRRRAIPPRPSRHTRPLPGCPPW